MKCSCCYRDICPILFKDLLIISEIKYMIFSMVKQIQWIEIYKNFIATVQRIYGGINYVDINITTPRVYALFKSFQLLSIGDTLNVTKDKDIMGFYVPIGMKFCKTDGLDYYKVILLFMDTSEYMIKYSIREAYFEIRNTEKIEITTIYYGSNIENVINRIRNYHDPYKRLTIPECVYEWIEKIKSMITRTLLRNTLI
jgi:hypothetical protein